MATQPAFSPQFLSPALAPDLLRQQYQMQQAAALGRALSEDGMQMPQGQMVSGHYVAPSIAQYMGKALNSYIGGKLANSMPDRLANMQRTQQAYGASLFGLNPTPTSTPQQLGIALRGGGQSNPAAAQMFPVGPSGTLQQPPNGAPETTIQPSAPQSTQQPSTGYAGSMPLLPGRTPQQSYQIYALMGPQEYMKQVALQGAPTDVQKNLIAQGIQPGSAQWNAALSAVSNKAGYIAPVNVAPGGTIVDSMTNRPTFNAPQDGRQVHYDTQGNATVSTVPGWNESTSADAQAKAIGQAAGTVIGTNQGQQAIGTAGIERTKLLEPVVKQYQTTVIPGESTLASVNRALGYIDRLDQAIGNGALDNVTGPRGQYAPTAFMSQDAANALEDLNSIKSKVVLNTMNEMRQASAAGATGFGNMQQNELKVIEDSLGSISRAQDAGQIRQNLAVIRDAFRGIANSAQSQIDSAKSIYKNIPGIDPGITMRGQGQEQTATKASTLQGPNGKIPRISGTQDYNSLPSGAQYYAPDGKLRTKR